MIVDGTVVEPPYVFRAIGDPETMRVALEIPGGALSSARGLGADVSITESDRLEIWSVAEPRELDEARVVED